jgi:hypothetical protein
MTDLDKALATQLSNIEARTGKRLAELATVIAQSGITKHGEIVAMLKSELKLGHGDANTLVHYFKRESSSPVQADTNPLDLLYVGPKAALRPIHEKLLVGMEKLGAFETAPKKTYVSYRRARQFTMIGPATNTRVEVGLNIKELPQSPRLVAQGAGKMCNFVVKLSDVKDVDADLLKWIAAAYKAAG